MKNAYVYVLDTLADWELGYVIAELNSGQYFKQQGERIPVKTVGATKDPVTTKGGMTIIPDMTVDSIMPETSAILLLPGADSWKDPKNLLVIEKTKQLLDSGCLVAAICGATAALAEAGILDQRPHTSNSPEYLSMFCPNYKGAFYYKEEKIVDDGQLITTGSAGGLHLARQVMERLDVMSKEALSAWYEYYRTGDANHFYALMDALSPQH
ncbi:DJ-1/PfpI family protein [Paenibacillus terrigena]|uniref:DJ-1/PfpI family protein n=1 Tax=Paenibacillus terrigena TaxID=369333 RepID=UPI000373CB6B|nr:DJ-1/PfpI family protein [Paenibacillus terrigena]